MRYILYGFGNPGRQDDGLGPECIAEISKLDLPDVHLESNYHLNPEDSQTIAEYDIAIFVDASTKTELRPWYIEAIQPRGSSSFTSHGLDPASVLGLANNLFKSPVKAFVLGIIGYQFDNFGEGLSEKARQNLDAAVAFLKDIAEGGGLELIEKNLTQTPGTGI
jgi:hydrogenase maturation protease